MSRRALTVLAALLMLTAMSLAVAAPAAAEEKDLIAGGPPWTLSGLNADQVTVAISGIVSGVSRVMVGVTYTKDGASDTQLFPVNVFGTRTANVTLSRDNSKVDVAVFNCTAGKVHIRAEASGAGY